MTRKDYILIARALLVNSDKYDSVHSIGRERKDAVLEVAQSIAAELKYESPRFNREHFLAVVRGEKGLASRPPRA